MLKHIKNLFKKREKTPPIINDMVDCIELPIPTKLSRKIILLESKQENYFSEQIECIEENKEKANEIIRLRDEIFNELYDIYIGLNNPRFTVGLMNGRVYKWEN